MWGPQTGFHGRTGPSHAAPTETTSAASARVGPDTVPGPVVAHPGGAHGDTVAAIALPRVATVIQVVPAPGPHQADTTFVRQAGLRPLHPGVGVVGAPIDAATIPDVGTPGLLLHPPVWVGALPRVAYAARLVREGAPFEHPAVPGVPAR